jgi:tRNA pseudouridine55 synthase
MSRSDQGVDGLAVVDKPAGMTSHDVVARFRRIAQTRRVGHAGTLDPMATGVLILAVGRATRLLNYLNLEAKSYSACIRLGQSTTTDDAEGEVISGAPAQHLTEAQIRLALERFVGEIMQTPASVSAIKVGGERAYKLARAGETIELAARPVTVSRFDAVSLHSTGAFVDVDVEVDCSSGTYVRALARDVGAVLGVGGHLTRLRRTRVGRFGIEQAVTLEQLAASTDPVAVSMADAVRASMPVRQVTADEVSELSFGRALSGLDQGPTVAAIGPDGEVVALVRDDGGVARPILVFVAR